MILVDTSVWVDHLRARDTALADLLERGQVLVHPVVIGELALGHVHRREIVLRALHDLPQATVATDQEVLIFIGAQGLAGSGIGYADAQLLAAAQLTAGAALWTRDRKLLAAARRSGLAAPLPFSPSSAPER